MYKQQFLLENEAK